MIAFKRVLVVGLTLFSLVFFQSCVTDDDTATSSLNVVVSASGGSDRAGAMRADTGLLENGQKYSFTPTSFNVKIQSIILFSEWTQNPDDEWIGSGKEINISVDNTVDLITPTALSDIYEQQISVDSDKFGEYIGAKVLLKDTIVVSGTVTINNATYEIDNVALPIGFSGSHFSLSTPLNIQDTVVSPTIRLIFETDESVMLMLVDSNSGDFGLPVLDDGKTRIRAANMVMIPYVGSDLPTIEKYKITIENDTSYSLKMLMVQNPEDEVVTAAIAPVFYETFGVDGFNVGAVDAAAWTAPVITQDGSSYSIEPNPLFPDEGASDRMVIFSNFTRGDHSGTLEVGYPDGVEKSYTAKLYDSIE